MARVGDYCSIQTTRDGSLAYDRGDGCKWSDSRSALRVKLTVFQGGLEDNVAEREGTSEQIRMSPQGRTRCPLLGDGELGKNAAS